MRLTSYILSFLFIVICMSCYQSSHASQIHLVKPVELMAIRNTEPYFAKAYGKEIALDAKSVLDLAYHESLNIAASDIQIRYKIEKSVLHERYVVVIEEAEEKYILYFAPKVFVEQYEDRKGNIRTRTTSWDMNDIIYHIDKEEMKIVKSQLLPN